MVVPISEQSKIAATHFGKVNLNLEAVFGHCQSQIPGLIAAVLVYLVSQKSTTSSVANDSGDESYTALTSVHSGTPTFRVLFFTWHRLSSFQRTFSAACSAVAIDSPVVFEVSVDYDPDMSETDRQAYRDYLQMLSCPLAQVKVTYSAYNRGLKDSIITTWPALTDDEYAIFVVRLCPFPATSILTRRPQEDDIEVSPYFLKYAERAVLTYVHGRPASGLMGISLYRQRFSEILFQFVSIDNNDLPYLLQYPESWGAVLLPQHWRHFLSYQRNCTLNNLDPVVPESYSNNWSHQTSWKKTYIRFLLENGGFFLYPNLAGNLSFSTNRIESGGANVKDVVSWLPTFRERWEPPLVTNAQDVSRALPEVPLQNLEVYDLLHKRIPSIDQITKLPLANTFDKCTMVIKVQDEKEMRRNLAHYGPMSDWGDIVVIAPLHLHAPTIQFTQNFAARVGVVLTSANSMFSDWPIIRFDCVVNVEGLSLPTWLL